MLEFLLLLLCFMHIPSPIFSQFGMDDITLLNILLYGTQIRFTLRTKNKNKQTKNGRKIGLPNLRWEQTLIIRVWRQREPAIICLSDLERGNLM